MKGSRRAIAAERTRSPAELEFHSFVPERAAASGSTTLVVAVHGISRNALEQMAGFSALAEQRGWALMAPCFDTPFDEDYQRLGRRGRGRRADLALDEAIARLADSARVRFDRRFFFGYSGGGQFVHRYLMAHPSQVDAAVIAAAGWYTFPDSRTAYPAGLRVEGSLAGVRMDPSSFLRVPLKVAIGSLDVERDQSVRQTVKVDARQGGDRVERARRWVDAMKAAARTRSIPGRHELEIIEGVGHSYSECVEAGLARTTFEFFDSVQQATHPGAGSGAQSQRSRE